MHEARTIIWLICFREIDRSLGAVAINCVGPIPRKHLSLAVEVCFEDDSKTPPWDGVWVYDEEPPDYDLIVKHMQAQRPLGAIEGAEMLFVNGETVWERTL